MRLVLAAACLALALWIAVANIAGWVRAARDRRRGFDRDSSVLVGVSALPCMLAWWLAGDQLGAWCFVPVLIDPGGLLWILSAPAWQWAAWCRRRRNRDRT